MVQIGIRRVIAVVGMPAYGPLVSAPLLVCVVRKLLARCSEIPKGIPTFLAARLPEPHDVLVRPHVHRIPAWYLLFQLSKLFMCTPIVKKKRAPFSLKKGH